MTLRPLPQQPSDYPSNEGRSATHLWLPSLIAEGFVVIAVDVVVGCGQSPAFLRRRSASSASRRCHANVRTIERRKRYWRRSRRKSVQLPARPWRTLDERCLTNIFDGKKRGQTCSKSTNGNSRGWSQGCPQLSVFLQAAYGIPFSTSTESACLTAIIVFSLSRPFPFDGDSWWGDSPL